MIRPLPVVLAVAMLASVVTVASSAALSEEVRDQIRIIEAQLAKEPIQKSALLPVNSAQCSIYNRSNIAKMEKLLKLHEKIRTADVPAWREHVAWAFENCYKGPADIWPPLPGESGDFTLPDSLRPQTLGWERAFDLYDGLVSEKAQQLAIKIAKAYEDKYAEAGVDRLLLQARKWRQEARETLDSIRSLHQELKRNRARNSRK